MILVVTRQGDTHGHHIIDLLRQRGTDVEPLDYSSFPLGLGISIWEGETILELPSGASVRGSDVESILYRREATPVPPASIHDPKIRDYIIRESENLLESLPYALPDIWVSNPENVKIAARKPFHLAVAKRLGFNIPRTLFTNSPCQASSFSSSVNKPLAVKTLWTPGITIDDGEKEVPVALYTRKLTPDEIHQHIGRVRNCPLIFQEYVEKKFELRITVVGHQVFACAIWSQASEHTVEDWRRYDLEHTPHEPYQLPPVLEESCRNLVRTLGLQFGCIDMIVTPEDDYVFLEINPNGQWLWIEQLTNLPISEAIVKLLSCHQK